MASYAWQSDWTDSTKANDLTNRLYEYCRGKIDILNHLEYAGLYSLGVYNSTHRYEAIKNRSYTYSTLLKQQYIKNKLQTL
jgi:hypothetical protein